MDMSIDELSTTVASSEAQPSHWPLNWGMVSETIEGMIPLFGVGGGCEAIMLTRRRGAARVLFFFLFRQHGARRGTSRWKSDGGLAADSDRI